MRLGRKTVISMQGNYNLDPKLSSWSGRHFYKPVTKYACSSLGYRPPTPQTMVPGNKMRNLKKDLSQLTRENRMKNLTKRWTAFWRLDRGEDVEKHTISSGLNYHHFHYKFNLICSANCNESKCFSTIYHGDIFF